MVLKTSVNRHMCLLTFVPNVCLKQDSPYTLFVTRCLLSSCEHTSPASEATNILALSMDIMSDASVLFSGIHYENNTSKTPNMHTVLFLAHVMTLWS